MKKANAFFLDSSALVKRFVQERGSNYLLDLVGGTNRLMVSRLAHVEVASTLARRGRAGDIEQSSLSEVFQVLESEFRSRYDVFEIQPAVMTRSIDASRTHALRASDAIQLASLLMLSANALPHAVVTLVSSDVELNAAAQKEGIKVVDPIDEIAH